MKRYIWVACFIGMSVFILIGYIYRMHIGERALKLMYNFSDPIQLSTVNMPALERMCDDEVMARLSVNNPEMLELNYYRFLNYATSVNIKENGYGLFGGWIKFSYNNDYVDTSRLFLFQYTLDVWGTITNVEMFGLQTLLP